MCSSTTSRGKESRAGFWFSRIRSNPYEILTGNSALNNRGFMHAPRPTILFAGLLALAFASGCGPKYPKCEKDEHCAEHGEVCVNGTCQQCRDDSNCAEGMTCKGGRCEPKAECTTDSDCTDNKVCRSGKCQIE